MGKPKLLLPWRGTTVIGHLLSQWQELGAAQIAIVLRVNDSTLKAELDRLIFSNQDPINAVSRLPGFFIFCFQTALPKNTCFF
jgi:CTP:molybdopterin cytidylyltransferase MocA